MLKRLLSFWWFFLAFFSNSDILISLHFFFFSYSNWNQWLMLAFSLGCTWKARQACLREFAGVSWSEGDLEEMLRVSREVRGILRATVFWVFASHGCYHHFGVEEQTEWSHRWSKLLQAGQWQHGRRDFFGEKYTSEPVYKRSGIYSGENQWKR